MEHKDNFLFMLESDMSTEDFMLKALNPVYVEELWVNHNYPHAKFQPGDRVLLGDKEYTVLAYNDTGEGDGIEYILEGRGFHVWEHELEEANHDR